MTNKNIVLWIVIIVLVVGGGALWVYNQNMVGQNGSNDKNSIHYNPGPQGKVIIGIKDAAASMGTVTAVTITVNKVDIHSASQGWVTISSGTHQYDLLALKASGATMLFAQTNVSPGTYDQVRLAVSNVTVTQNGVQTQAKLPSGELKITGNLVVNADKTSTAVIDFMTDKSLHVTGNGQFIFTPVIKLQAQSETDATVDQNNQVHITTGHTDADINEGMDVNGEMKADFEIDSNTKLDEVDDVIKISTDTVVK